jgi:hypothetical protein
MPSLYCSRTARAFQIILVFPPLGTPSEDSTSEHPSIRLAASGLPPCLALSTLNYPQPTHSQPSPHYDQAKPSSQASQASQASQTIYFHCATVTLGACHYRQTAQHILHYAVIVPPLLCTPHLASGILTPLPIYDCTTCPRIFFPSSASTNLQCLVTLLAAFQPRTRSRVQKTGK